MGYTDHLDLANAYVDGEQLAVPQWRYTHDPRGASDVSGQAVTVDKSRIERTVRYSRIDIITSLATSQALVDAGEKAPRLREWEQVNVKARGLGLLP